MSALSLRSLSNRLLKILAAIFVSISVCFCKPEINPDSSDPGKDNPGREQQEDNTEDPWKNYSEGSIINCEQATEPQLIPFTDINGSHYSVNGHPGLLFLTFQSGTPVKEVWNLVIKASGEVVGQNPDFGYYTVKVEKGQESNFVSKIKGAAGLQSAFPLFDIESETAYYIDRGAHGINVLSQMKKWDGSNWTSLIDIDELLKAKNEKLAPNNQAQDPTIDELADLLLAALNKEDCEVINISSGPHYGKKEDQEALKQARDNNSSESVIKELEKKVQYGYTKELNDDYIQRRANWINRVCESIEKSNNYTTPVILSAGNDYMHNLEDVLDKVDKKYKKLLGTQVVLVSAEQEYRGKPMEYSNILKGRDAMVPVVNINGILDITNPFLLLTGTSFAAPNYVRYLRALVTSSAYSGQSITYMQAVKQLADKWMELHISAWSDVDILKLIYFDCFTSMSLDDVPEKVEPQGGKYNLYVSFQQKDGAYLDEVYWEIYADCDWIHFDKTSGTKEDMVTMSIDGYSGEGNRYATVVLKLQGADDCEDFMRYEALIQQEGARVISVSHDVFYALPDIVSSVSYYYDDWKTVPSDFGIDFQTNFKVSKCFLDDSSFEYEIKEYYGLYAGTDGIYDNSILLYLSPRVPVAENCGWLWQDKGLRSTEPVPSRSTDLYVRHPEASGERKQTKIANIVQVGLPCITMTRYRLNDVSVSYDVDMEGKFSLDFDVNYPDDLTKSACKSIGFIWSSKDEYYLKDLDRGDVSIGNYGIMKLPLDARTINLSFFQFPLTSRTFEWTIDMFIETVDEKRVYASAPATISHTF